MNETTCFGDYLHRLRTGRGYTDIADYIESLALDVSADYYGALEKGYGLCSPERAIALCSQLDTNPTKFWGTYFQSVQDRCPGSKTSKEEKFTVLTTPVEPHLWPVPRRGEIWSAFTPTFPRDIHQPRPVVILSSDGQCVRNYNIYAVPLNTANAKNVRYKWNVVLEASSDGLKNKSVAKCNCLFTLERSLLVKGPFGAPVAQDILERITDLAKKSIDE